MPTLGELCNIESGTRLKSSDIIPGNYPVIRWGKNQNNICHNYFNKNINTIICTLRGPNSGIINMYETEVWIDENHVSIHSKDNTILNEKYLYYYLKSVQYKKIKDFFI